MINEYLARLFCLCLATYFAVQLAAGLVVRLAARWIVPAGSRLQPRLASRILLTVRWMPPVLALFVVALVCVPSYLRFEPGETGEELGTVCLAAAGLALAVGAAALIRGSRQVLRSRRCVRSFGTSSAPVVAIVGIRHPRVLISPVVRETLNPEQLDAALRHERAHGAAYDNLKRLLLAFTPGILPGINGLATIERQWARLTEWAADDDAVAGDTDRALALASALVSVARLGAASVPLASSMLEGYDLTERVDRLLSPTPPARLGAGALAGAALVGLLSLTSLLALALRPASLESAHQLLEQLVK